MNWKNWTPNPWLIKGSLAFGLVGGLAASLSFNPASQLIARNDFDHRVYQTALASDSPAPAAAPAAPVSSVPATPVAADQPVEWTYNSSNSNYKVTAKYNAITGKTDYKWSKDGCDTCGGQSTDGHAFNTIADLETALQADIDKAAASKTKKEAKLKAIPKPDYDGQDEDGNDLSECTPPVDSSDKDDSDDTHHHGGSSAVAMMLGFGNQMGASSESRATVRTWKAFGRCQARWLRDHGKACLNPPEDVAATSDDDSKTKKTESSAKRSEKCADLVYDYFDKYLRESFSDGLNSSDQYEVAAAKNALYDIMKEMTKTKKMSRLVSLDLAGAVDDLLREHAINQAKQAYEQGLLIAQNNFRQCQSANGSLSANTGLNAANSAASAAKIRMACNDQLKLETTTLKQNVWSQLQSTYAADQPGLSSLASGLSIVTADLHYNNLYKTDYETPMTTALGLLQSGTSTGDLSSLLTTLSGDGTPPVGNLLNAAATPLAPLNGPRPNGIFATGVPNIPGFKGNTPINGAVNANINNRSSGVVNMQ